MHAAFSSENIKSQNLFGNLGVEDKIISAWALEKQCMVSQTKFIWIR
jgi:hypothetical protein